MRPSFFDFFCRKGKDAPLREVATRIGEEERKKTDEEVERKRRGTRKERGKKDGGERARKAGTKTFGSNSRDG